jgi:hypothetical protein
MEARRSDRQDLFEQIFMATSAFSAAMSFFIVLTCFVFPSYGNKYFVRLIFWMCVSDLCASSVAAVGFPASGTWLCSFQSFWSFFFFRAYWVWTVALSSQLYRLIVRLPLVSLPYLHAIVWSLAMAGTLVPLSSGARYGMIERFGGNAWCFLDNCSRAELRFWVYASLQSYVWISISLMIVLFVSAYRHHQLHRQEPLNTEIYDNRQSEYSRILLQAIYQISLYPLSLALSWGPVMVLFPLYDYGLVSLLYFDIALVMGTLNGVFAGSIFLFRSKEVQTLWLTFLRYDLWRIDAPPPALLAASASTDGTVTSSSGAKEVGRSTMDLTRRLFSFSRETSVSERIESIEITSVHRLSIFSYEPSKEEIGGESSHGGDERVLSYSSGVERGYGGRHERALVS